MTITHASIVPLIGGETIGSANAFGAPPIHFMSYEAFAANDSHILNYYDNQIPYYVLDKDMAPPLNERADVVSSVCPCAGLSTMSMGYGDDNPNNQWMKETANYILGEYKPKVFWGENAPGFAGKIGKTVREELKDRIKYLKDNDKLVEAQRLQERTTYDLEMMQELGYCQGIENYSRYLSGRNPGEPPPCLFDYLPKNAIVFMDESHVSVPQIGGMYKGDRSRKETLVDYGFRLPSALDNRPLRFEEWEDVTPQKIYVSATPGKYEMEHSDNMAELLVRPTGLIDPEIEIRPATSQIDDVIGECNERAALKERVLITTLTKRMAEDLTDYLEENGIRTRYMHSDVDTVERTEIIRDLRLGHFDVLVGINLLREGLDIPEVSLVAILDADKEGFLRSEVTLIQTVGRAARNIRGKAIMYADKVTGSMQRAMDEMSRRREIQVQFNKDNNITPKSIVKDIKDVMEGARVTKQAKKTKPQYFEKELPFKIKSESPDAISNSIKKLEEQMYIYAKETEYEKAAFCRDQIKNLKWQLLNS